MLDIAASDRSNSTPKINEDTPAMWIVTYGCDSFLDLMPKDQGLVCKVTLDLENQNSD